jgi:hypothetical protein
MVSRSDERDDGLAPSAHLQTCVPNRPALLRDLELPFIRDELLLPRRILRPSIRSWFVARFYCSQCLISIERNPMNSLVSSGTALAERKEEFVL